MEENGNKNDRINLKEALEKTKKEIEELGGVEAFKKGTWIFKLIRKSFKVYFERANADYFRSKYGSKDNDYIANKLISVASRNAGLLGGITGLVISTDEVVAIVTGGEGGVGIPANVAIGISSAMAEAVLLVRIQLKLVAELAKVYGTPLDPNDPEDILTILAFALGGSAAEAAGKVGMKVGVKATERLIKKYISKEILKKIKDVARKIGIKLLQRTIIKYAAPGASIGIGSTWNYFATKTVGKIAKKHLLESAISH